MTASEMAWLGYQVKMGSRLDLEKLEAPWPVVLQAVFEDGYNARDAEGA
jgi:hypothetical protein